MYDYSALRINTAPATEPLSTADFKAHGKLDDDDEDTLLGTYISVARQWVERVTGRALVLQTWDVYYDRFPWQITLPKPPLSSVTHIKYIDQEGTLQTLASSGYDVDSFSEPSRIIPAYSETWPTTRQVHNAVQIQFVAGYAGTADSPPDYSSIPDGMVHAMKLLTSHFDQHRQSVTLPDISAVRFETLPLGTKELLNQHRVVWF